MVAVIGNAGGDEARGAGRRFIALVQRDGGQDAVGGGGHFHGDLVGLQLHDRLIALHRVADVLQPGAHHRFGAFLLHGHDDVGGPGHQKAASSSNFAAIRSTDGSAHSISSG